MQPTMPDALPTPAQVAHDPVGIVVTDLDTVAAYLDMAVPPSGYVVIRTAEDVPERLGGLAILAHDALTPALRDALTRATLGA